MTTLRPSNWLSYMLTPKLFYQPTIIFLTTLYLYRHRQLSQRVRIDRVLTWRETMREQSGNADADMAGRNKQLK